MAEGLELVVEAGGTGGGWLRLGGLGFEGLLVLLEFVFYVVGVCVDYCVSF